MTRTIKSRLPQGLKNQAVEMVLGSHLGPILMYHRVADEEVDPWGLCVSPALFAEQMALIAEQSVPTALSEILEGRPSSGIPRVAVTFDDGYADNLFNALPILERHQVPATVFVVAGAIGQTWEFWWDELEQLMLTPGQLPSELELRVKDRTFSRALTTEQDCSARQLRRELESEVFESARGSRLHLFKELWEFLSRMPADLQREVLLRLWDWAGRQPVVRPSYRVLTVDELTRMSGCPLIEIGAHTMTHPRLPLLSREDKEWEIIESKAILERNLNIAVDSFSYPFGMYDPQSAEIVKTAGIERAVLAKQGDGPDSIDAFALPRIPVGNWTAEVLANHLSM